MGIEAVPAGCVNATMEFLDDYPGNRTGPILGYLMVGTFSYAYYAGTTKIVVAEEGPHFFVDVNSLVRVYANSPKVAEDDAGTIFLAPQVARTASGFPLYKNGSIVITRIPRPIFLPVSVEQFLQARIRQAQTEPAKLQAERGRDSTAYTRWLADRDKRQRERERNYKNWMVINPKAADDSLRSAEKRERDQEEIMRHRAAPGVLPSAEVKFQHPLTASLGASRKGSQAALHLRIGSCFVSQFPPNFRI